MPEMNDQRRWGADGWLRGGWVARVVLMSGLAIGLVAGEPVLGAGVQEMERPTGLARVSGDRVLSENISLRSKKAHSWNEGGAVFVLLEGDVTVGSVEKGGSVLRMERAVVRVLVGRGGEKIVHHLLICDASVESAGAGKRGTIVAMSSSGRVRLDTDLLVKEKPEGDAAVQVAVARIMEEVRRERGGQEAAGSGGLAGEVGGDKKSRDGEAAEGVVKSGGGDTPSMGVAGSGGVSQEEAVRRAEPAAEAAGGVDESKGKDAAVERGAVVAAGEVTIAKGVLSFHAERIVFDQAEPEESSVALMGNVQLIYSDESRGRSMSLRSQNAVLYLSGGDVSGLSGKKTLGERVKGVYLEGDVQMTDGEYTVRSPRVFYDLQRERAVLYQAVFYTWDRERLVPVYVRAEEMRQEGRGKWSAKAALLTTSEFGVPHYAIGSEKLSLSRTSEEGGGVMNRYESEGTTLEVGSVPVFYWPFVSGDAEKTPLRKVSVGTSSQNQASLETQWDLFSLMGRVRPEGVRMTGDVDYLGVHGPGLGVNLDYDVEGMYGRFGGYLALLDNGDDRIGGRQEVDHDGDQRGHARWQHRQELERGWELSLELGYVSDPTYLEEFFRSEATSGKPYETSIYLKKQEDDWAFTFLMKHEVQDFTAQTTVLESPGYTVDKLPEIAYWRVGTSLWGDRLTYFTENRLSRVRIRAGEDRPSSRGLVDAAESLALLGVGPGAHFDDGLDARGVTMNYRWRYDTRHEISAPVKMGVIELSPYVAGRVTGYDDDFAEYRGEGRNIRLMGTAGTRARGQVSRVDADFESPLLDMHRLRHLVEPGVDVFQIVSTSNPEDAPAFDTDVEDLREGFGVRAGLRNTVQTQRGGSGRWRTVDWLVVDTDLVHRGNDADTGARISRFFGYRPEYSRGGNHFDSRVAWMLSDTLTGVGEAAYNFDHEEVAEWRAGLALQQTPRLLLSIDYKHLEVVGDDLLTVGAMYRLTRKYAASASYTIDFDRDESRSLTATLERRLPGWRLLVLGSFDVVEDEQVIGVRLVPEGEGGSSLLTPAGPYPDY